jgi:hypothetical protein
MCLVSRVPVPVMLYLDKVGYVLLCRASMHSFFIDCQSLRELRITGVLIIAATQKEMWVGS